MDNPKVEVRDTNKYGKALFAKVPIKEGEVIADWTGGRVYTAEKATLLPNDSPEHVQDHAIQFGPNKYIDYGGIGRFFAHSCEPNCGYLDSFRIVTMRDIAKGEELTFDYEMSEDSDWRVKCICGKPACRGVFGAAANLPEETKRKYGKYLSPWIREKYSKEHHIDED